MAAVEVPNAARPSFLETVLSNAGQVEISDLKERIEEVSQNVSQLKLHVYKNMTSEYVDFDPLMKKTKGFLEKAMRTSDEINNLFNRIEFQTKHDLANSTGELCNLHESLKKASGILAVTSELLQMDEAVKIINEARDAKKFVDAAKSILIFKELLHNSSKETQQLDIFKSLQREFQTLFAAFYKECCDILCSFISWESTDLANNVVRSTIKIASASSSEIHEVMQAMHFLDLLDSWVNRLRNFSMRSILLPLINNEASVSVEDGELSSCVQVAVKLTSQKPSYSSTLDNLTKFFEFVHGELDVQFENGDSFVGLLGYGISEEFTDNLMKKCLKETVPSSSAEEANISAIRDRVSIFNRYLAGIEFLSEDNHTLLDYVENFDALCANKACENYLAKAREIMKEDLHDMVEVGPQSPALALCKTLNSSTAEQTDTSILIQDPTVNVTIKPESELNHNLFQFPTCCVSKSTLKILDLVTTILDEATRSCNVGGSHQFYISAAKSVFELYIAVVPKFHEKLLSTIPQQVALFHNNCMYLAHRLVVLGFEVEASLRNVLNVKVPITFVDHVLYFRHLGTTIYLKHMQQQRKQMLDVVKESGLATLGENSELSPDTERKLHQCLRQLEVLQTVWQNVLPRDVYCKSVGVLANAFLEELILRVSSAEDIPASTEVQLTTLFKMVQERIPKLFEESSKVVLFVKRWLQFQELIIILGASLRVIEERWSDGKGPLAHEFTVEQVKQLVRALFQNTARRAEVLSKIK